MRSSIGGRSRLSPTHPRPVEVAGRLEPKASDLFVQCLEAEGVRYVFGSRARNARPQRVARRLEPQVRPGASRAGRCVHGRHVRGLTSAGVCLGTLGPGATNLITASRTRSWTARRWSRYRPGRPRAAQGVPPVPRHRQYAEADHQVQHAAVPARHPRGGPQGVQGRAGAEAGADAHRASRGRHGRERQGRAAARPAATRPEPAPELRRRSTSSAPRSGRSCWPATASPASARAALREFATRPASGWPRRSWARACSPTTTRATSARSGCSRATTRWPASRTPTS